VIDLRKVAKNLTPDGCGLWVAKDRTEVSYPDEGNDACFEVEDSSFWFQHRNSVIKRMIRTYAPDESFFDIGGGNGFVSLGALKLFVIESVPIFEFRHES
jgi:hypothetical protein